MLALCGALAASLIADIETWSEALLPQATSWWIGSVALLLLSALLASPAVPTLRVRSRSWSLVRDAVLLTLLTALSLALRLPNLTGMPYIVHGDEAANGLQALRWLHGGMCSRCSRRAGMACRWQAMGYRRWSCTWQVRTCRGYAFRQC